MYCFSSKEILSAGITVGSALLCCASFLFLTILLSLTSKKIFCWKSVKWHYKFVQDCPSLFYVLIILFFIAFMSIRDINKKEVFAFSEVLALGICASFYLFLKWREPISGTDVNNCQKDSESIGAFWAHQVFEFYYKIVFKDLIDRMKLFEKEHNIKFSVYKLIIIIPLSCNVENTFDVKGDLHQNIEYFGDLSPVECDQGGNVNRKYKNPVYKIKEDVYIGAEYPCSLGTLHKTRFNLMEETEWIYHRKTFIKTLKMLTKGSPCIVATYDDDMDNPEPFTSFLLSLLNEERKWLVM